MTSRNEKEIFCGLSSLEDVQTSTLLVTIVDDGQPTSNVANANMSHLNVFI